MEIKSIKSFSFYIKERCSFVCIFLLLSLFSLAQDYKSFPMWDEKLPFEKRVNDLVGRLTLDEKVMQMMHEAPAIPRLGIPAYNWWNEILHGVARTPFHVTSFPQAIGMAAAWDTNSMYTMADYAAMEGRAVHNKAIALGRTNETYLGLTYWTPNINIFRDPRWGRGQETYGEDPFLTAMLGKAFVRGLQGDDPKYLKAAACAKHFAVHSGPEPTRHSDNFNPSAYDLWDTYLPAFRELITKAKVAGVMCAYNAIYTQPCCANDLLMNDILRNQWKFTGYAVSDCWAVDDFYTFHKTHKDIPGAGIDALVHGTDIECGNSVYKTLKESVRSGAIKESQLDISLKRLFMIRYRLGMFDPPSMVKYAKADAAELESAAHKAQALKMARQSIVLLRNENHILPLSKKLKKIAVLGPNADNEIVLLGNYNGTPSKITTLLQGIKEKLGSGTEIVYERAIDYALDTMKTEILAHLDDVDAIIFAGGITSQLEGEALQVDVPGFKGGDRTSIMLPSVQTSFLKKLKETGKPVVFVMMTGSALAIPWESENIPAIINAWYGGQSGGTAIADVIFGDYNPAGRLPVTFYKSDTDLPSISDYDMSNRTYRYFRGEVLYPFGYGLSYSEFQYANLKTSGYKLITVSVDITNKSKQDGEEVTELYISHPDAIRKPLLALKGFQRIFIKAGETRHISFTLDESALSLVNEKGETYLPKGKLIISVGGGQPRSKVPATSNVIEKMITIR